MTPTLETPRLVLRATTTEDAPQIQALFPHWEIVRHLAAVVPWPYPPDGAESFLRHVAMPQAARGEAWHWTIRQKTEPDRIIGSISLQDGMDTNRGFWMGLPWQGQGFMDEAADAVTDFWFDVLGRDVLRVPKAVDNVASRRISERQGMRVIGVDEREYVSGRARTELWEITAEEWRAGREARQAAAHASSGRRGPRGAERRHVVSDIDKAVGLFDGGCACSQAMLAAYGPRFGLDEAQAVRVAAGFAGGMKMGETCGAVTGALMVLGLAHCGDGCRTQEGRQTAHEAVVAYEQAFRDRRGALSCRDLLGLDLSTPEGQQAAKDRGGVRATCSAIVRDAAELLEPLLPSATKV